MSRTNSKTDVFRFVDIPEDGDTHKCWPWTGAMAGKDRDRPTFSVAGKKYLAYRIVYEMFYGKDPGHLDVRHTCDNSVCCNPHHLELGTRSENVLDNVIRDRTGLPVEVVRAIKEMCNTGDASRTSGEIARDVSTRFSVPVAASTVRDIRRGARRAVAGQMTAEEVEEGRKRGEHVRTT